MPTNGGRRRAQSRIEIKRPRSQTAAVVEQPAQAVAPSAVALKQPLPRHYEGRRPFWLVQRLEGSPHRHCRGLFRYFACESMGSVEFEVGRQFQSRQRMRAAGNLGIRPVELTHEGITRTVYFVGPLEGLESKIEDFHDWLSGDPAPRSEEWTNFVPLFVNRLRANPHPSIPTIAWWSLDDDITWTLDEVVAEQLLEVLALVPAS